MSNFLRWVSLTHTHGYHAHDSTAGQGHVSQGRFKSFPIQDNDHYFVVSRYGGTNRSPKRNWLLSAGASNGAIHLEMKPGSSRLPVGSILNQHCDHEGAPECETYPDSETMIPDTFVESETMIPDTFVELTPLLSQYEERTCIEELLRDNLDSAIGPCHCIATDVGGCQGIRGQPPSDPKSKAASRYFACSTDRPHTLDVETCVTTWHNA